GLWASRHGAAEVVGVYRSHSRVEAMQRHGIKPLHVSDRSAIEHMAGQVDITFDALGGPIATSILEAMRCGSVFVGYGLLTGRPVSPSHRPRAEYRRFHLRDELETMSAAVWQQQFHCLWPFLRESA